jgi:hypothetical protein
MYPQSPHPLRRLASGDGREGTKQKVFSEYLSSLMGEPKLAEIEASSIVYRAAVYHGNANVHFVQSDDKRVYVRTIFQEVKFRGVHMRSPGV